MNTKPANLKAPFGGYVPLMKWYRAPAVTPCVRAASATDFPFSWSAFAAFIALRSWVGGLPVCFVALFVDHRSRLRAATNDARARSLNSDRCSAKCSDFDTSSRLSGWSFSLFRSLWCTPMPRGTAQPLCCSHTTCARNRQVFGSATLTQARCSPPRLCRVRIRTVPTGEHFDCEIIRYS
jgi:hypothetical protein